MLLLRTNTYWFGTYVCMCVCVELQPLAASGSHTHTSSQVSVLLAAEQRGCVTVCSALSHALAAN